MTSAARLFDGNRTTHCLRGTLPVRPKTGICRPLLNVWQVNHSKSEDAYDGEQHEYDAYDAVPVWSPLQPFHRRTIAHRQVRKAFDLDARHNVHNVRNREVGRGTYGSLSARDMRSSSRATSANGKNTGRTSGGACASSAKAAFKWSLASASSRASAARTVGVSLPANTSSMLLPWLASNCSGTNSWRREASSGKATITWAMPCARPAWRARWSISGDCWPATAAASENSAEEVSSI